MDKLNLYIVREKKVLLYFKNGILRNCSVSRYLYSLEILIIVKDAATHWCGNTYQHFFFSLSLMRTSSDHAVVFTSAKKSVCFYLCANEAGFYVDCWQEYCNFFVLFSCSLCFRTHNYRGAYMNAYKVMDVRICDGALVMFLQAKNWFPFPKHRIFKVCLHDSPLPFQIFSNFYN